MNEAHIECPYCGGSGWRGHGQGGDTCGQCEGRGTIPDHQSEQEQSVNRELNRLNARIKELLVANNRFEQRGRCAERLCGLMERIVLTSNIGPTLRDMAIIAIKEHRKDNPK